MSIMDWYKGLIDRDIEEALNGDPNFKNNIGNTALMYASQKKSKRDSVESLLNHGADPNIVGGYRKTALHHASSYGHIETVELLLNHGADPNMVELDGKSSLICASICGHRDVVELLLDKGADPNINAVSVSYGTNLAGEGTALMYMGKSQGVRMEIVELLLDKGADPNIVNDKGKTALMYASDWIYRISNVNNPRINGHRDAVELLLDKGVDPNITDPTGKTALIMASDNGNIEIVELLLDNDSDPNIVDNDGKTALRYATDNGHTEIVKVINDKIALQHALQNLAMAKSMNSLSSPLQYLDYDIMKEIMIHARTYDHGVHKRMK
jgi:ankyrin repeat protein